jgi:hypothetical protein
VAAGGREEREAHGRVEATAVDGVGSRPEAADLAPVRQIKDLACCFGGTIRFDGGWGVERGRVE